MRGLVWVSGWVMLSAAACSSGVAPTSGSAASSGSVAAPESAVALSPAELEAAVQGCAQLCALSNRCGIEDAELSAKSGRPEDAARLAELKKASEERIRACAEDCRKSSPKSLKADAKMLDCARDNCKNLIFCAEMH